MTVKFQFWFLLFLFLYVYGQTQSPTRTVTPRPSSSTTPTPAPSSSNTPTPTSSNTPAPSSSNTPAPTSSNTPAPSASKTRYASPSRTPATGSSTASVIDNFYIPSDSLNIEITYYTYLPVSNYEYTSGSSSNIIGGERDFSMIINSGPAFTSYSSAIDNGSLQTYSSYGGYGKVIVQWDGFDESMNLNPSGLGHIDLTQGGKVQGIQFSYFNEGSTNITVNIYSGVNSTYCTYTEYFITSNGAYFTDMIPFNYFTLYAGGCEFTDVGAIEMIVEMPSNSMITIGGIYLYPSTFVSNTPSPSPSPSSSTKPLSQVYIDTFSVDMNAISYTIDYYTSFPVRYYKYEDSSIYNIIGGERDVGLSIFSGNIYSYYSTSIENNEFTCYSESGNSQVVLQYDGYDGSMNLNPYGLGGYNLGNGNYFSTRISSESYTPMLIYVYSGSSNDYCFLNTTVNHSGYYYEIYDFYYSSFTEVNNGCNFSNVGAIEIKIQMEGYVRFTMEDIFTFA